MVDRAWESLWLGLGHAAWAERLWVLCSILVPPMYGRIAQRLCVHRYRFHKVFGLTLAHVNFFLPLILIRGVRTDWISVLVRPSPSKCISTRTIPSSVRGVRAFSSDSAWTPHGLEAPVMQGSVPCWQPASPRGVRTESVRSPHSPRGLTRNTWGTVKTSKILSCLLSSAPILLCIFKMPCMNPMDSFFLRGRV